MATTTNQMSCEMIVTSSVWHEDAFSFQTEHVFKVLLILAAGSSLDPPQRTAVSMLSCRAAAYKRLLFIFFISENCLKMPIMVSHRLMWRLLMRPVSPTNIAKKANHHTWDAGNGKYLAFLLNPHCFWVTATVWCRKKWNLLLFYLYTGLVCVISL